MKAKNNSKKGTAAVAAIGLAAVVAAGYVSARSLRAGIRQRPKISDSRCR